MYPRTEYEMSEEQLKRLKDACKPTPCMMIGGVMPRTQQENANAAWQQLGEEMGFDYMMVRPVEVKNPRHFTAVPSETAEHRAARLAEEAEARKQADIMRLRATIWDLQYQLKTLTGEQ